MAVVKFAFLLVFIGSALGSRPAVRLRITQKGMDYALESTMNQSKRQMLTVPIKDIRGKSKILNCDYAVTNMQITKVNIGMKSARPVPNNGLFTVVRNVDVDLKGDWQYKITWFSYSGGFSVKIKGLNVGVLVKMVANNSHLAVSNVTCASKLDDVSISVTGPNSWIFHVFKSFFIPIVKSKIPKMVCDKTKKMMKENLNKKLSEFPVTRDLKNSVTLDYSMVENPAFGYDSADMFFKIMEGELDRKLAKPETKFAQLAMGEFQPSDGSNVWMHEPRRLPLDFRRDRMIYLTITDHVANSAGHAFYNQGALKVDISAKQAHSNNRMFFNTNAFRSLPSIYGLNLIHVACPDCNLHINMKASSPPTFHTNTSGIHITLQGIADVNAVYPNNSSRTVMSLAMNVTALVTSKLNAMTLLDDIDDLRITARLQKPVVATAIPGRIRFLEGFVKREVENFLKKQFSAFRIPSPVSNKVKLVNPKVSYGQGYATLESDFHLNI